MKRVMTILTENFSDWEIALTNSVGRGYYGFETRFATPGGAPVTSSSGMLVTPHLAIEDITLDSFDLLIVCGGTIWQTHKAPDISELLLAAHKKNIVVAGICDGTRVLAQAGLLDHLRHTSNSAENLSQLNYAGAAYYQNVPYAVADRHVVTAPGTAPVSFMVEVFGALGIERDENFNYYLSMYAAEHNKTA
ncbi:type 1 glutamine amidotransferase family protein [Pragia fontium]|uniref:type 1 glutamine amidotransferase family protein n=1 Tax=Pragia fontium TaxID=82985 RepID=UPI00064A4D49|nr:type 1 glutamine amidotransferase family protein [Pragia fontium]AKJ42198.1 glutamine amidotransferase [Pragia fontium]